MAPLPLLLLAIGDDPATAPIPSAGAYLRASLLVAGWAAAGVGGLSQGPLRH
jgi:hypothetical protein